MLLMTQKLAQHRADIDPHRPGTRLGQDRDECCCVQVQHPPAPGAITAVDLHRLLRQAEFLRERRHGQGDDLGIGQISGNHRRKRQFGCLRRLNHIPDRGLPDAELIPPVPSRPGQQQHPHTIALITSQSGQHLLQPDTGLGIVHHQQGAATGHCPQGGNRLTLLAIGDPLARPAMLLHALGQLHRQPGLPDSARARNEPQPGGILVLAPGHQCRELFLAADEADQLASRIQQPCPALRRRALQAALPRLARNTSLAHAVVDRGRESTRHSPDNGARSSPRTTGKDIRDPSTSRRQANTQHERPPPRSSAHRVIFPYCQAPSLTMPLTIKRQWRRRSAAAKCSNRTARQ